MAAQQQWAVQQQQAAWNHQLSPSPVPVPTHGYQQQSPPGWREPQPQQSYQQQWSQPQPWQRQPQSFETATLHEAGDTNNEPGELDTLPIEVDTVGAAEVAATADTARATTRQLLPRTAAEVEADRINTTRHRVHILNTPRISSSSSSSSLVHSLPTTLSVLRKCWSSSPVRALARAF